MVQVAIKALQSFGAITRRQATDLLKMWAHKDQLDETQVKEVLRAFP